jgi:hypothetical protein
MALQRFPKNYARRAVAPSSLMTDLNGLLNRLWTSKPLPN